jgi:LysM domain-containing protein
MTTAAMTAPAMMAPAMTAQAPRPVLRAPRLRLTRRGRAVVTTLVSGLIVSLALALVLNGPMATANSDLSTGTFSYVTVEAGQSLWHLAESIAPGADPRDVIHEIVRLNQLQSSVVHPGDRLAIPQQYTP